MIKADNIVVKANAIADNQWSLSSGNPEDNAINIASRSATDIASAAVRTLGINVMYSQANASAEVLVKGNSLIQATKKVDLSAETTSKAGSQQVNRLAGLVPLVAKSPLALGGLYARVDAKATVQVDAGVTIKAADFSALANNTAELSASMDATPNVSSSKQIISIAVGVTEADVQSRSSVSGTLNVSGSVKVTATNKGSYENDVTARTGGSGRAAAAVAYSARNSDATAELKAYVDDATKVEVMAVNNVLKDFVSADSTAGLSGIGEVLTAIKSKVKTGAQSIAQAGLFQALGLDLLKPSTVAADPNTPTQVGFRLAGAVAYANSKDEARASIEGAGLNVHATESIAVASRVNAENTRIFAESSATSNSSASPSASDTSRQGYSAGLAIGNYVHNATASVGADVTLTAPRIGVLAETIMPIRDSLLFGSAGSTQPFDRYTKLSSITGALESDDNVLDKFNGASSAKAKGDSSQDSAALSGSASLLNYANTTTAVVEKGAKLNLSGSATGIWNTSTIELSPATADKFLPGTSITYDLGKAAATTRFDFSQAAEVSAKHNATLLFQGGSVIPASAGAEKGLGIALNDIKVVSHTDALVREGSTIRGVTETTSAASPGSRHWTEAAETATPEVNISAISDNRIISLTTTSGIGATFGVNGSVSVVTLNETTHAWVDDEASVRAKSLAVTAISNPVVWSLSGGINLSKGASVGVGIAVNDITSDTRSAISDNDTYSSDGNARASLLSLQPYSALNPAGTAISAPVLAVTSHTGGHIEAIAVTGAIANQTDDVNPGFFDRISSKYNDLMGSANTLISNTPQNVAGAGSASAQGVAKPKFGLAGAGSAAVNTTDMKTSAVIDGVYINQTQAAGATAVQTLVVRGISDSDITTAAGAAAVTRANSADQKSATGIAGSIAVNMIGNGNEAVLRNSTVINAGNVSVQALSGGEQLSVAIGAAVDASTGATGRKTSIVGSLSLTLAQTDDITGRTKNFTRALIDTSTITADTTTNTSSSRDLEVTAYNRTRIGTGGGALSVQATGGSGSATSVGGAVTYSDIRNDVDSRIAHATLDEFVKVSVQAINATEIGAGAAMGGVSAVANSNSIAGAVVITEVTNHTTAAIGGESVIHVNGGNVAQHRSVTVVAKDKGADTGLEQLIDPDGKRANTVAGLDYCGSQAGADLSPGGNCITSVAGVLQLSRGNNVGASINYNHIENNLTAQIENAEVNVTGVDSRIDVNAHSSAKITGLALGIGASEKFSGAGSVAIAEIHNAITASASRSATAGSATTLTANTVAIEAGDASRIKTVAGQLVLSSQQSAVGAAATYNNIANTVLAKADGATVSAATSVSISSLNNSSIQSLAIAGGLASKAAVSGSLSLNFIKNSTQSHSSATFDDSQGGSNTNAVSISALDSSTIESLAGSVAIGKVAGAGGAFAWNAIDNQVRATVDGAAVHRAASFDVLATETSTIKSLSAAVSGGQNLALSGSVSINHVGQSGTSGRAEEDGNVTSAEVTNATFDGADLSLKVVAKDTTEIKSLAGAVAVATSGASVGGAVADNAIRNIAKALVTGSSVASAASVSVRGSNASTIDSLSAAAAGGAKGALAGSASSNRTANRTIASVSDSSIMGAAASMTVAAVDSATIRSLSGAAAFSGGGGFGAAVSINKIDNATDARVSGKKAGTSGYKLADLTVNGASIATIQTLAVGLGAGANVGVAGSAAINLIGSNTQAHIDSGATVTASGSVGVLAQSDDKIEVAAGAIGIGASAAGVAASTAVNSIGGTTEAYISGANTEVNARALTGTGVVVDTGTLSGAVDLAGVVGGSTTTVNLAGMRQTETVKGLAVNASATHQVRTTAVNVAAGAYAGIGATASVSIIGGDTKAYIDSARINANNASAASQQQTQIKASDHAYANTFIGGVSGGAAGIGAAADVNIFSRNTLASLKGSQLDSKARTEIGAWSSQGVSSLVVGLSGGGVAAVGTGALAKFTSTTEARTDAATVLTGTLDVKADHATHMFLTAGAVALGGAAFAGTFAVGLDNSVTKAHIDGGTVNAQGQVDVKADSSTELRNIGVSGAGAGGVAVAGMAVVALLGNTTQAYVSRAIIGSAGAPTGGLAVTAKDSVNVDNKAGAAAGGGAAGIGLGASVTKVGNTVSAYIEESSIDVVNDVVVKAAAERSINTFAATAGVSAGFSLAGAAGVIIVGSALSSEANNSLGSSTDSSLNSFASKDRLSSSENVETSSNFSQSDIDRINAAGKTSTTSSLATGVTPESLTQRTRAVIQGSDATHVKAGSDIRVLATEKDKIALTVGAVSIGAIALGGSVALINVVNNVEAGVVGKIKLEATTGDIEVAAETGSLSPGTLAVSANALQGSGGIVGLGAAVSKVTVANNIAASVGRGTTSSTPGGSIRITATDTTDLKAEALGLNVGLVGAGVTISTAAKSGATTATLGDDSSAGPETMASLGSGALLVQAVRSGQVKAGATAGAGGILAGSGADANAKDEGSVEGLIGNSVQVQTTGNVQISATATPQTAANALGVNVGAGAVGASLATATASTSVKSAIGKGTAITAAELLVTATRAIGTEPTALAKATGASGGLLFGINATSAKADSSGTTTAAVGDGSVLTVLRSILVKADSQSQQISSGLGISVGGLLAIGADKSRATSDMTTEARLGNLVNITGASLQVDATGKDSNYAHGVAGSGGMASAPLSEASTVNTSVTTASTGSGNPISPDVKKIHVTSILVSATHEANFDSWIDSTNASLFGASGAKANNVVNSRAEAHVGASGFVEADQINIVARNTVLKAGPAGTLPGLGISTPGWNVNSSSGGLADVPAAASSTAITTNALTQVDEGAVVVQIVTPATPPGVINTRPPGSFLLDAANVVTATDKVKMSSGGAISAASGSSSILADNNNATVVIGAGASMTSLGDLSMGSRSVADVSTQTAVDVYGLVGVAPAGDSVSRFKAVNAINIGADAALVTLRDLRLAAGANTAGEGNKANVSARSDVFNNTAIPVNRAPVADAVVDTLSSITIAAGATIEAVRNVQLYAEEGTAHASGIGIGKDVYREALASVASTVSNAFGGGDVSFETRTGNSVKQQASKVTVEGEVRVGTRRKQELVIGIDGHVISQTEGISTRDPNFISLAADILRRIKDLQRLVQLYTVDDVSADASIAVTAYKSEISFLNRKLDEMGFQRVAGETGFSGVATISPLEAAQQAKAAMTISVNTYSATQNTLATAVTKLDSARATLVASKAALESANSVLQQKNATMGIELQALDPSKPADVETSRTLNANITSNKATIASNTGSIQTQTDSIAANLTSSREKTAEINTLAGKATLLTSQIKTIDDKLVAGQFSGVKGQGPVAAVLTISDVVAQLGNIYVRGDQLQGKGTLNAPGDAEIKITNQGQTSLIIKNLTIPAEAGGKIYFNSVDVGSNEKINALTSAPKEAGFKIFTADSQVDASGAPVVPAKPRILIESQYDPLADQTASTQKLAPEIIVQGVVSNLRGLVKIDSAAGNIRIDSTASVRAGTVDIKTRNGDFVQSYSDAFVHVAGAPLVTTPADTQRAYPFNVDLITRTPEAVGAGIVANGSVLIAARYLNINGIVQSGIAQWGVNIPLTARVDVSRTTGVETLLGFAAAKLHYDALTSVDKAASDAAIYKVIGTSSDGQEKIRVNYNAATNQLELAGVQVQGGYVELFGQIFNTNSAGGNIRVMDGYGQVKVDNQTALTLVMNTLDTGRGVKGQVNITNITGLDANNAPKITKTTFTRDAGAARTGYSYLPETGLVYSMTVGYDSVQEDYYRYSQSGWFGKSILSGKALDQYKINSIVTTNSPLSRGEYLQKKTLDASPYLAITPMSATAAGLTGGQQQVKATSTGAPVEGSSWRDCNWWTACINATYYQEFTVTKGSKTTITDGVKADNPIGIEYIGSDQSNVNVNSVGNVRVTGSVYNRNGDTLIKSAGSITQSSDLVSIGGNNISLSAGTGIGTGADKVLATAVVQALQVNVKDAGRLDAVSQAGDVRVKQMVGDLKVGTLGGAGVDNVVIETAQNLLAFDSLSQIQGKRIELVAQNGAIGATGSGSSPLTVRTGYTRDPAQWPHYGLQATARDSINIKNVSDTNNASVYSGDLLLISARSAAGDVRIETTGKVIDNNPFETIDLRNQQELANLWDSLALRGAGAELKAAATVKAFSEGKNSNYQLYWQLRKTQADQGAVYDPGFKYQLSAQENDALKAAGLQASDIAGFAENRTRQYHALNLQVGNLTQTFESGFKYAMTAEETGQITKGSKWTDLQLALSVGAGLIKNITNTVTVIKEPNVQGRNITLIAGTAIGSFNAPLTIDVLTKNGTDTEKSAALAGLTVAQKAALASAERGDVTILDNVITISQPRPVNVTTGAGALTATAEKGLAFIGSQADLRINSVIAAGDVRIKTAGSLINAASRADAVNVEGRNMIFEAANGGIGSVPSQTPGALSTPLRIKAAADAGVTARASSDIWISAAEDLNIDTLFSRSNINLDSVGSILDIGSGVSSGSPKLNIRSNNLTLKAETGSIGSLVNPLAVSVNRDGRIAAAAPATGQGIYLHGPVGENFNIGSAISGGAISLSSANVMLIDGEVKGLGPISLSAGDGTTLSTRADVRSAAQGISLRGKGLVMKDDPTGAARLRSDTGEIDIETTGDIVLTGIETRSASATAIRIVSTEGHILNGGDTRPDVIADASPTAQLTVDAKLGMLDNALDVRISRLKATSGEGSLGFAARGALNIVAVNAADRVTITALGDITGNTVQGKGDVSVIGKTGVELAAAKSTDGGVTLGSSNGNVTVTTAQAAGTVSLAATAGSVNAALVSTGGNLTGTAGRSITIGSGTAAGVINLNAGTTLSATTLTSQTERISAKSVEDTQIGAALAYRDIDVDAGGALEAGTLTSLYGTDRTRSGTSTTLGTVTAKVDVSVNAGTSIAATTLHAIDGDLQAKARNGSLTVDTLESGRNADVDALKGSVKVGKILVGGEFALRGFGDVAIEKAKVSGIFMLSSAGGSASTGTVDADSAEISAPKDVTVNRLDVKTRFVLQGNNVGATVYGANKPVLGTVTGYQNSTADNVNLLFSNPTGMLIDDFKTRTADVKVPVGSLDVSNMLVSYRASVTNPLTTIIIDQLDRSIQSGANVQLYSAGAPFSLSLFDNHVLSSAYEPYRDVMHDGLMPTGLNRSIVETSEKMLTLSTARTDNKQIENLQPGLVTQKKSRAPKVTYSGFPVSINTN